MADQPSNDPRPSGLIIDSDWKAQAQAEKERLSEKEQPKKPSPGGAGSAAGASPSRGSAGSVDATPSEHGDDQMPPADFRTLVGSLATQALMYMGGIPDPETGRAIVALDYAKHAIDLLGVLEAKTTGNLTKEEIDELTDVLRELRTRFVQITQAVLRAEEKMLREESAARLAAQGGAIPPTT